MRRMVLSVAILCCGHAAAWSADFENPVRLEANGAPVRVDSPGYAAPCWADVDGDGKKDLLVGQLAGGKIRVYRNLGDGKLAAGKWLQAGGKDAEVPGVWCCTSSTPQFVDLDGDGFQDILSGSYSRREGARAGLFQLLRGSASGSFQLAAELSGTDGEPLIIPMQEKEQLLEIVCTRPYAVDWNGDGHLDLVAGNAAGSFYWFRGEGRGKFQPQPEPITTGDKPLKIDGHHSDPFAIDWDGDGDLDLLSGSTDGSVQWAENSAGKGATPVLKPFQTLIKATAPLVYNGPVSEDKVVGPTYASRIWVDDVNGDGKLDVLVGDRVFLIAPAKGLSVEQFRKKYAQWQEEYQRANQVNDLDEVAAKERGEQLNKLLQQRANIVQEESTGFVWLYIAK